MEFREAKPEDIGQLAYIMMLWRQELPEQCRFFDSDSWIAERAASIAVHDPSYLVKVLVDGDKVVGETLTVKYDGGLFSPYPYGVILSVFVRKEYRGHQLLGYKLLCDAVQSAKVMGLSRVEFNPMIGDRGTELVLKRIGFNPICTTYFMEFNHGQG